MKKLNNFLYFFISFLFMEILFKIITFKNIFNMGLLNNFLFILIMSIFGMIITSLFKSKTNRTIAKIILFLIGALYSLQICVYDFFDFFFSFALFGAAGQTLEFAGDIVNVILSNLIFIILFLTPSILLFIFGKKIDFEKLKSKSIFSNLILGNILIVIFFLSLLVGKNSDYSPYKLYFKSSNAALSIQKLGVVDAFFVDSVKTVLGFEEKIDFDIPDINFGDKDKEDKPVEKKYEYNNLDIDFADLLDKESNTSIKNMHQYFSSESGTLQNEYTGFFKNKNLILFMAESFNEIAVSEELTPTLYKLTHEGFIFDNFYTPTISSTIGGEYQELTGLYASSGFVTNWKKGTNSFPMGLGNIFKEAGYDTFAYHDHNYTFQNRYKYLPTLGFTNFKGCGSGLEKSMNCKQWPEDDVQMIEATTKDYLKEVITTPSEEIEEVIEEEVINTDTETKTPFMVYYATVSGHGDYTWTGNSMSKKNKALVDDLPYSDGVKAYIAAQIQLDRALETLIKKLEESGDLDDTVIALVGDHYPYMLTIDQINEAASYKKDNVVEVNHSNFILWNNKMDTVHVTKVGSQIDVLPTLYNVFGMKYDSRIIIGKDILSTEPGLAMFGNRSWVSDYGTYFSSSSKFVPKDDVTIPEDYVTKMNKIVSNKITMSNLIITNNYYKKVLGD